MSGFHEADYTVARLDGTDAAFDYFRSLGYAIDADDGGQFHEDDLKVAQVDREVRRREPSYTASLYETNAVRNITMPTSEGLCDALAAYERGRAQRR
jgi:hypothetical protein